MKKIILSFAILIGLFSCEKALEDTYDELGDVPRDLIVVDDNEYTLTEDDYTSLSVSDQSFGSDEEARTLLSVFLDNLYPSQDNGSLVNVSYNVNNGDSFQSISLPLVEYASNRTVDFQADVLDKLGNMGIDTIEAFETNVTEEQISDIILEFLPNEYPNPEDQEAYLVSYSYFETVSVGESYDFTIEDDFNAFEAISVTGDQVWIYDEDGSGARMNGFVSSIEFENEDWLISPAIDLTSFIDPNFSFTQELSFTGPVGDLGQVLISTDYETGTDHTMATWIELDVPNTPGTSNWFTDLESGLISLSAYEDNTVHIAFVYNYPDGDTPRWDIVNFLVAPEISDTVEVVITEELNQLFQYSTLSSSWSLVNELTIVDEDYENFGTFDNSFSTNEPASDFIPTYLDLRFPFSQKDDSNFVEYSFDDETTRELYSFNGEEWEEYSSIEMLSLQFGKINGIWEPDNTITYTLVDPDDYNIIVNSELADNPDFSLQIGSMTQFQNFDRRLSEPEYWNDEMIFEALAIFLDNFAPDAEIGQKYAITFATWNPGDGLETFTLIKDENGEWVSF